MSDGNRSRGSGIERDVENADLSARQRRLAVDLDQIQRARESVRKAEDVDIARSERSSGLARGFQLSSEFVASVLVGAAIGWGIDYFLPTSPWGLVVFLLLGFGAGVVALIRSASVRGRIT